MEPTASVDGLGIWVFDSVLPSYEHDAMYAYCVGSLYRPHHVSDHKLEGPADSRFTSVLTSDQVPDVLTTKVFTELAGVVGASDSIDAVYINCYDVATKCAAHVDAPYAALTMLYYANPVWDLSWGGETLFFSNAGEIAFASILRPNRAVLFDSRIRHIAKVPTTTAAAPKFSVVYKGAAL